MNNNKCKYHRTRSHKKQYYGYCVRYRKKVPLFCKCNEIEYKKKKTLKSRTKKQAKKEKERFSIIYPDLTKCCVCGLKTGDFDKRINQYTYIEKNEVFEGSYRSTSIRLGMITPLCIFCHKQFHSDILGMNLSFKVRFQKEYMKTHSRDEFIDNFGQDYEHKLSKLKK